MTLKTLIDALRAGQELPNSTRVKWAGLAFTAVSLALTALGGVAVSRGWIASEIPPEQIYELSSLLVSIVLGLLGVVQVTTTPRIGVLPPARDSDDDPPAYKRVQSERVPPDHDARAAERADRPPSPFEH